MKSTKDIFDALDHAKLELRKVAKDASKRGDEAGEEEARKSIVRIASVQGELERGFLGPGQRRMPVRVAARSEVLDRPFRDTLPELEKRIDRLIEHFRHAEQLYYSSTTTGAPTAKGLLWLLFKDAAQTAVLLPDRERQQLSRVGSVMPESRAAPHDDQAIKEMQVADYAAQVARLQAGMQQHEHIKVRETASAAAADRMVDIMDLLRFVSAGRRGVDAQRYKRTFLAHALGHGPEFCTRVWDKHRIDLMSRQSLNDVKQRVLGQVLAGIERHFGLARTSRGFRRLTVREIERRKKIKQETKDAG